MLNQKELNDTNLKIAVWQKAKTDPNRDPNVWRKDVAGAWIKWDQYSNRNDELNYGWEIDHLKPTAKGGSDDLKNLRPLHWKNNCSKGDNYPTWKSAISSDGNKNIHKTTRWTIQ